MPLIPLATATGRDRESETERELQTENRGREKEAETPLKTHHHLPQTIFLAYPPLTSLQPRPPPPGSLL